MPVTTRAVSGAYAHMRICSRGKIHCDNDDGDDDDDDEIASV